MTDIKLTGLIVSMNEYNNAVNMLVIDKDNVKGIVYKVPLRGTDSVAAKTQLKNGDEITVNGKVSGIGGNKYGNYIELQQCELVSMAKVQRTMIQPETKVVVEEHKSLPQKGEQNHGAYSKYCICSGICRTDE